LKRTKEFLAEQRLHLALRGSVCAADEDLEEPVDEALPEVDPDVEGSVDHFELLLDEDFLV
jgi:hypothetical protein